MKVLRRNRKAADCGVIAAFNASSWCKKYRPYEEIYKIAKSCGYSLRKGIFDFQFVNLMKKLGLPAKRHLNLDVGQIECDLYMGKCYLISYFPKYWSSGHLVTVFMDKHGNIKVINPEDERLTWPELASDIYAKGMNRHVAYELPCRDFL